MRPLLRLAVTPILLGVVVLATFLAFAGWNTDLLLAATLVFTLLYLALFERLIPLVPAWRPSAAEAGVDSLHLVLVTVCSAIGSVGAFSAALHLHRSLHLAWPLWHAVPLGVQIPLAIVIGEFLPYWYHRASHVADPRRPASLFLWRVHAIHHIPPKLNSLKTSWMHPVNSFLNAFTKMFPVLLLGFGEGVVFAVAVSSMVVGYLSHANIDARTGPLDYLLATPHVHHFHHSVRPEEARNYGNNIPFWDLVFGTYFHAARAVEQVGVRAAPGASYPALDSVPQQLRFPFVGTPGP